MTLKIWRGGILLVLVLLQACSFGSKEVKPSPKPPVKVVVTEGQAPIEKGKKLLAKQLALQDAIRQASIQAGAEVTSQTMLNQSVIQSDAVSFHAAAQVTHTQILNEWALDNVYYVRAQISLSTNSTCVPHYRKRILATAFPLAEQSQVSGAETQDLAGGIPREINNQLMESKEFIGFNATHVSLYGQPRLAPEFYDDAPYQVSGVMQLANNNGAQIVLSGVIRDLQIESGDYIRGSGPTAMFNSFYRDFWSRRGIGIDVYLHDGFTGALLFQYRYTDAVEGDVWLPPTYTVGSERFNATPTGEKISKIITLASQDIRRSLACYPFATRINKIEKNKIYIDAGAQDNVRAGDQLIIYTDASDEFKLEGNRHYLDHDKRPAGVLTINDVKPRYAVGTFEVDPLSQGVRIGDWVRSW